MDFCIESLWLMTIVAKYFAEHGSLIDGRQCRNILKT